MSSTSKPFILIDGSSYLFRAYYALPALLSSKGVPTGAIYGVINMLKKLIKDYQPEHIAVVFDPKGKTFRHGLYEHYKANRTKMPDELQMQIQPLFEVIQALGFPLVIKEGVEADDVIATLTKQACQQGMQVLISTGDKDLAQLVCSSVTLINTMSSTLLDESGVQTKFGVTPQQIIDYLILVGDTSDNIPGVPGVGPKTAVKWLQTHGSLEELIAKSAEIKGKVGESFRAHLSHLPLYRQLVTVKEDVELEQLIDQLKIQPRQTEKLIELFTALEFKNWLTEVLSEGPIAKSESATNYCTILDKKTFIHWIKKLEKAHEFALDTETTDLNPINAECVGISICVESQEAAYIPFGHSYENAPQQLSREWVLRELQAVLHNSEKTLIGQNIKYDYQILTKYGVEFCCQLKDTMLESYIVNSVGSRHDLNSLSLKYLGKDPIKYEEVVGSKGNQIPFAEVTIDKATEYAAEDADLAFQLHQTLMSLVHEKKGLEKVLTEIEMPLVPVLARMETKGVMVDMSFLQKQSAELEKRITELEKAAFLEAGCQFNLNSPKQLQEIFFEKLQLPVLKKTPGGQPSTGEEVLQDLALQFKLPQLILEHRSLCKLKSTYTDKLPLQVNAKTGRIHTSYNQAVTATGRLSSNHPNLQNIPIRTAEGRKIREAFIVPRGYKMLAADYSQVELRIIAHISQDQGLLQAFANEIDIHQATAAEVFAVELEQVTHEQRRSAKAINFGLLYGMSSFGLSKQLGIDRRLAQEYIDIYFARYPKVQEYMHSIRALAAKQGYVETLFGRRLYVPDINSTQFARRSAAERVAINAPMQGTAADIIKIAMIQLDQWLQKNKLDIHMIMQVHDELVFEVREDLIEEAKQSIKKFMENAGQLSVPLIVEMGVGNNWDEAH